MLKHVKMSQKGMQIVWIDLKSDLTSGSQATTAELSSHQQRRFRSSRQQKLKGAEIFTQKLFP